MKLDVTDRHIDRAQSTALHMKMKGGRPTEKLVAALSALHASQESRRDLLDALKAIVAAWDAVDPNVQVPDEINDDDLWEDARAAIAKAEGR